MLKNNCRGYGCLERPGTIGMQGVQEIKKERWAGGLAVPVLLRPPVICGIHPQTSRLLVYNAPVPDPENQDTVSKDRIYYSPVPDTIFIQSLELTGECFAGF